MKHHVLPLIAVAGWAALSAAPAMAQSSNQPSAQTEPDTQRMSAQELTRRLNAARPSAQPSPQPAPQRPPERIVAPESDPDPVGTPEDRERGRQPLAPEVSPRATPPSARPPAAPVARPVQMPVPRPNAATAPTPRNAPSAQARPATAPEPEAASQTPPPARNVRQPAPALPLSAAAIAELPFRIDLRGTQIISRQAGPDATIYTVRQRDTPLLMIYAGPQSEFPIFYGEQAVVGDRVTIVLSQDNRRIAAEHLFRREGKVPADIHVWLLATEGEGAALAEQIGQTIDPR